MGNEHQPCLSIVYSTATPTHTNTHLASDCPISLSLYYTEKGAGVRFDAGEKIGICQIGLSHLVLRLTCCPTQLQGWRFGAAPNELDKTKERESSRNASQVRYPPYRFHPLPVFNESLD